MADQIAAAEQAEQADSSVQEPGTQDVTQPSVNWEERAKEHQSWGTRLAQENAELKTQAQLVQQLQSDDPAEQRKALEALGYQVPEEEEDSQVYEPDPRLRQELDELKQWKESLTESQQREQNYTEYRQTFDPQLKQLGVPESFHDVVADAALDLPAVQTPQGPQPDLQGAWTKLLELLKAGVEVPEVQSVARKSWANTKPSRALTSPGGTDGTQVPNLDDQEERHAYMAQRLADLNADN